MIPCIQLPASCLVCAHLERQAATLTATAAVVCAVPFLLHLCIQHSALCFVCRNNGEGLSTFSCESSQMVRHTNITLRVRMVHLLAIYTTLRGFNGLPGQFAGIPGEKQQSVFAGSHESAWHPAPHSSAGVGDSCAEEEERLPNREELVVSTFRRLFPNSFAGVAAVRKHKALAPSASGNTAVMPDCDMIQHIRHASVGSAIKEPELLRSSLCLGAKHHQDFICAPQ